MRVCAQEFGAEVLSRIEQTMRDEPLLSRRGLSRRVCEWLGWRDAKGRLKAMSCRVALKRLASSGVLLLPAAAAAPCARGRRRIPERPAIQPFSAPLSQLGAITLRRVGSRDSAAHRLWKALLHHYHYLGAGPLCGAQLRYLIHSERHGVLGALAFSAPAWRVAPRDHAIGWSDAARRENLQRVVSNSRFLIAPQVVVKNLASRVLGLCAGQVTRDWLAHYGIAPVLLESFVEQPRFTGVCYRAANWRCVGLTQARGRQDGAHARAAAVKQVYLYPLCKHWQAQLQQCTARPTAPARPALDWAQAEFAGAALGDARLTQRLCTLARDFGAQPRAQIPQACGSRAKTKAAYRFFDHEHTTMKALLQPHYDSTAMRVAAHPVVLVAQDTTSLNYSMQPSIEDLGPIGSSVTGPIGLLVHDSLALTPEGTPLGLVDVQCWARDEKDFGKKVRRKRVPIEQKESHKWLTSFNATAQLQARCPSTTVISVADREADVYELFAHAHAAAQAPKLLIRASSNRTLQNEQQHLWQYLHSQPIAGYQQLHLSARPGRAARLATLAIRYAAVTLRPPSGKQALGALTLQAVWACEVNPPPGAAGVEWMLLTTCAVDTPADAVQTLKHYAARWNIEVYHRTLKSGCKIEERQLGNAQRIEACLSIDMVVAWRIMHLTKLGRELPDVPCSVYFEDNQWRALVTYVTRNANLPPNPPTLREAIRMTASLGGFLGRRCDGEPGTQTLWRGLQRLDDLTEMYTMLIDSLARAPPAVSSA